MRIINHNTIISKWNEKVSVVIMEEYKFKVSIKRGNKIFNSIFSLICGISACFAAVCSIGQCKTIGNYIAVVITVSCLIICAIVGLYQNIKSVYVYKGKVIYKSLFRTVQYKPIEIYSTQEKEVIVDDISLDPGIMPGNGGYDRVKTFYDKKGKKLFAFGLAYDNVQQFEKYVTNNIKSFENSERKGK